MTSTETSRTPPVAAKPAAEGPTECPGCRKPLAKGATRCTHCGLAFGEHQRCPHCHAVVDVEPAAEARFVCALCGGVRIPIDDPEVARSAEQIELLRKATVARSARAIWRIIALAVAGFGAFSALVLWLVVSVAHPIAVGTVIGALAAVSPFAFSAFAWKKSNERSAELGPVLDRAWSVAARDIARSRGGKLDAATLAKLTRISEPQADQLLARMSAESVLMSSVTSEGGLLYNLVEGQREADAAR